MKVLVVVDMQNDFIDGALGTPEAVSIVDKVKKKIQEYRKNGDIVIFTRDTHTNNYLNTQEGRNLPVEHCIKGSYGWEISSKLEVLDSPVVNKPGFGSKILPKVLLDEVKNNVDEKELKAKKINVIEHIELVGLCTDICVIANAMFLKTAFPEVLITVDSNACAGVSIESHENALKAMEMCQIKVTR